VTRPPPHLFVHGDEVEASCRIFDPLLSGHRDVVEYPAGSWGPRAADDLLGGWISR
jgi:glucose-6-phosphate 1-dehydrogenase